MPTFLLKAKRDMHASVIREKDKGKINLIPKGYVLQVPSAITGPHPKPEDVEKVLLAMGFGPSLVYGYCSAGNWEVTKL